MHRNFHVRVLELVKQIPYGKVTTYSEIARALTGSVRAARAVGRAVARNPYPLEIPCHRVVRCDGSVGGYRLGVEAKIRRLQAEGLEIEDGRVLNFETRLFRYPEPEYRFVTDRMLGKLSTWLRILGHDTLYAGDLRVRHDVEDEDAALIACAAADARIVLTRDRELAALAAKRGVRCIYLQSDEVMEQLKELMVQHGLGINREPHTVRCSECNAPIRKVEKEEEDELLRAKSYVPVDLIGVWDFWICEGCGRVYWEGSHWRTMKEQLKRLK